MTKQLVDALAALKAVEWRGHNNRCPLCVGWAMSSSGETPRVHTKDCLINKALNPEPGNHRG